MNGKLRPLPRYYQDLLGYEFEKPSFSKYCRNFLQNGKIWFPADYISAYENENLFHNDVREQQMKHFEYLNDAKHQRS